MIDLNFYTSNIRKRINENIKNNNFYDGFFNTAITKKDAYNFLFINSKIEESANIIKILPSDVYYKYSINVWGLTIDICENIEKLDSEDSFNGYCNVDNFINYLVKASLYGALDALYNQELLININEDNYQEIKMNKSIDRFYYRGQSNYKRDLCPSIFRGLTFSKGSNIHVTKDTLFKIYNEKGYSNSLIDKYNNCFPNKIITKYSGVDYDFLAWMQHSISYSPLMDFTTDLDVALTFAITPNNPTNFCLIDSALFILELENEKYVINDIHLINKYINDIDICVLKNRIKPGTTITTYDIDGKPKVLSFKSFDNIIKLLTPEFILIDLEQNDRMKVQKGKFVLFYKYVSVNGNVFCSLNDNFHLFKGKMNFSTKTNILNNQLKIREFYKSSYLLNPYQRFED